MTVESRPSTGDTEAMSSINESTITSNTKDTNKSVDTKDNDLQVTNNLLIER